MECKKPGPKPRKAAKALRRKAIKAISADPRKKLIAELDRVFSLYIRARDGYKCMMVGSGCKCGGPVQCNHLLSRSKYRTRWDERNAVSGCAGHNTWAHYNEADWRELWQKLFPERVEYLMRLKNAPGKYSNSMLQIMIKDFQAKLDATVVWTNPTKTRKDVEV